MTELLYSNANYDMGVLKDDVISCFLNIRGITCRKRLHISDYLCALVSQLLRAFQFDSIKNLDKSYVVEGGDNDHSKAHMPILHRL